MSDKRAALVVLTLAVRKKWRYVYQGDRQRWMAHGTFVHRVILDGLVVAKIYGDPGRTN